MVNFHAKNAEITKAERREPPDKTLAHL